MRRIFDSPHCVACERYPEARPTGARIVLLARAEQWRGATNTLVVAVALVVYILACERALGRRVLRDLILLVAESVSEPFVGFFIAHLSSPR